MENECKWGEEERVLICLKEEKGGDDAKAGSVSVTYKGVSSPLLCPAHTRREENKDWHA